MPTKAPSKKKKLKRPKNYAARPTTASRQQRTIKYAERRTPAPPPLRRRGRRPPARPASRNGITITSDSEAFHATQDMGDGARAVPPGEAAFARTNPWYAVLASPDARRPQSASLPGGPRSGPGVHSRRGPDDGFAYGHVAPPLPHEDLDDPRATGKPHYVPRIRPRTATRRDYASQLRADSGYAGEYAVTTMEMPTHLTID